MSLRRGAGLSALVAVAICLPALSGGFVIDDGCLIVGNQGIRSLGHVPNFFLQPWGGGEGASGFVKVNAAYYRPPTSSLHALEYAVFGLRPLGWHLVSILLHASATLFVVLLAFRLVGEERAALWVLLGSAVERTRPRGRWVLAAVLTGAAGLAKEEGAAVPLLALG